MRRGLISWSRDEVPAAVLDRRVARLVERARAERLDAVLAYSSFARPAAVSWLTHFVSYWGEALLLVLPGQPPALIAASSKRGQSWIREVSHVGQVLTVPGIGEAAVEMLKKEIPGLANGTARIGIVERDELPWNVAEPMVKQAWDKMLVDASAFFAAVRQPADEAEVQLAEHAFRIAQSALDAIPPQARRASAALSAMDSTARSRGAEEVSVRIIPDLSAGSILRRIENDQALGDRYAVQLSLAYKGIWVRVSRCLSSSAAPDSWKRAQQWFAEVLAGLNESNVAHGPGTPPSGTLASWIVESCLGSKPFSMVSQGERAASGVSVVPHALPGGSLAVLSVQLALDGGSWHASAPFILGTKGEASRLLGSG